MFNNMTIKSRLVLVIGILSVLLAGVGGLGLYGIDQSNGNLKTVYEDRTVVLGDLNTVLDRVHRVRLNAVMAANMKDISVAKQR
uniref:Tar ligand binding domain-containing protein n=1 Tax=Nitrosomonas sp. TaxID=42353 RepID=UPI0035B3CBC8